MAKKIQKNADVTNVMTDAERRKLVGSLYVDRDLATEIFSAIDEVRERAKDLIEPRSIMLVGDSGMGKTTLLEAYRDKSPRFLVENCIVRPVLYVPMPVKPTLLVAASAMLKALEVPGYNKGGLNDRIDLLGVQLRLQKVEVVLIDETQHIVEASGSKTLPKVGDFFKNLSKLNRIPLVLAGIPSMTLVVEENEQLKRLCRRINMGPFTAADDDAFMSFRRFLKAVDIKLPFNTQARIHTPDFARLVFAATEGKIYNVMILVREAAMLAIESGDESIQHEHFRKAFDSQLDGQVAIKDNPFDPIFMDTALKSFGQKAA